MVELLTFTEATEELVNELCRYTLEILVFSSIGRLL